MKNHLTMKNCVKSILNSETIINCDIILRGEHTICLYFVHNLYNLIKILEIAISNIQYNNILV